MATVTPAVLQGGLVLTDASAAIITASATTQVRSAVFANPTTSAVTLVVTIKRSGASVSTTLVPGQSVAAGATYVAPELAGLVLANGDVVSGLGEGLVATVSGLVIQ